MKYVVHGATGAQGSAVLAALKASGKETIALTRNANFRLEGVHTINADCDSAEALADAYRGSDGVFVHLPAGMPDQLLTYAENISLALASARPGRVILSTSGKIIGKPQSFSEEAQLAAIPYLVRAIQNSGISHAVVSPLNFLENFLLPQIRESLCAEGVLHYPLRDDIPVSWTSHLDVADVVVELFERSDIFGVVGVGYEPGITGHDLASAFSLHFGKRITYNGVEPGQFGQRLASLLGEGPAAGITARYRAINALPAHTIESATSAQYLLGIKPRKLERWLATVWK